MKEFFLALLVFILAIWPIFYYFTFPFLFPDSVFSSFDGSPDWKRWAFNLVVLSFMLYMSFPIFLFEEGDSSWKKVFASVLSISFSYFFAYLYYEQISKKARNFLAEKRKSTRRNRHL